MNPILHLPTSAVSQAYPNLTVANHNELATLLEHLNKTAVDQGPFPSAASDWPIISPKGNINGACSKNILSIGGDRSSFYKQRWKNVHSLDHASVFLLDYYERCKHITKLGVLLTDVWRPSTLSRWSHIYEMYETMGIQSVALLYSGHQITPIRWPWR
jgi:hypothetical protein